MGATVVIYGFQQNISSIPVHDLANYLDKILDTDEIGTFRVRELDAELTRKYNVAIDFNSGYDAMYAQKILDGIPYRMPDGIINVLHAKVTHNPQYKSKLPIMKNLQLQHVNEKSSSSEDESELMKKQLIKAHKKVNDKLHIQKIKKRAKLTEEEKLLLKRKKLIKKLGLYQSEESSQRNLDDYLSSTSDEGKAKRLHIRDQRTSRNISRMTRSEYGENIKDGSSRERHYYFDSRSRSRHRYRSRSPYTRSSRRRSRSRLESRCGYEFGRESRKRKERESYNYMRHTNEYKSNNSTNNYHNDNRAFSQKTSIKTIDKIKVEPNPTMELGRQNEELESKRDEAVKAISLEIQKTVMELSSKFSLSTSEKSMIISKFFDTVSNRIKSFNFTFNMSVTDMVMHYRCKYSKIEDNEMVKEIFDNLISARNQSAELISDSKVDQICNVIENVFQECHLNSLTEDEPIEEMLLSIKKEKVEEELEEEENVTNITVHIIPTPTEKLIAQEKQGEGIDIKKEREVIDNEKENHFTEDEPKAEMLTSIKKEEVDEELDQEESVTNITVNIIPTPAEKLSVKEKQNKAIDTKKVHKATENEKEDRVIKHNSINITVDPNRPKKYYITIHDLMRKLKRYMCTYKDYIAFHLFEYVIRGILEKRIEELLIGKEYMKGKEIVKIYREFYPRSYDERFVCATFKDIQKGMYNDVQHSLHR